jgi:tRNA (cmo5U34)-methyltransferase
MTVDQAFNQSAEYYDAWMRKALMGYDALYGTAVRLPSFETQAAFDVLDLGAGTGLFSAHIHERYPNARFTLFDLAGQMLAVAQERFRAYPGQFRYVTGDLRRLPDLGAFDLVVSSMAIHHLEHAEKQALFRKVYDLLRSPGVFINLDQIKGPSPALQQFYWESWLEHVHKQGAPEEQIQASIQRRKTYDKDAPLSDQLDWLCEAGFQNVDCVYKSVFVGLFYGTK